MIDNHWASCRIDSAMNVSIVRHLALAVMCALLTACVLPTDRLVYDQQGVTVGIQHDPTIIKSSPIGQNSHPVQLSAEQIRHLLGLLQVSGWSGSFAGAFVTPVPIPVFSDNQLQALAAPIARALAQANPSERIFFSLPNPKASYIDDRTMGSLAVRGPYLHFVLTDHASFLRGDTGGGEERDPLDTKGMKLFVKDPAKPAGLAGSEEPHWGLFEKVHISIVVEEGLALPHAVNQPVPPSRPQVESPASPSKPFSTTPENLQLQIHELTTSNRELRKHLEEQAAEMAVLKDETLKLQRELKKAKAKPSRKLPAP